MADTMNDTKTGTVYTETVVYAPPERYASEAPYQIAIVDLSDGERTTVRIEAALESARVQVGDRVVLVSERDGVAYYKKA